MSELLKINVNGHIEKKNGLSYLSWAWAWAEVLKIDPQATWKAHEWNGLPAMFLPDGSAMVKVSVTIKGDTKECPLPVMNHRNQAIKNPDAFAINTATMRALAKCIGMHGLGLYIYAGEDLPPGEAEAEEAEWAKRCAELDELALVMVEADREGRQLDAIAIWYSTETWSPDVAMKAEEQKYVWSQLREQSALRRAIKDNKPAE